MNLINQVWKKKYLNVKKWFDDHSNDIKDVYEEKQKELESVFMELMKKVGGTGQGMPEGGMPDMSQFNGEVPPTSNEPEEEGPKIEEID